MLQNFLFPKFRWCWLIKFVEGSDYFDPVAFCAIVGACFVEFAVSGYIYACVRYAFYSVRFYVRILMIDSGAGQEIKKMENLSEKN